MAYQFDFVPVLANTDLLLRGACGRTGLLALVTEEALAFA